MKPLYPPTKAVTLRPGDASRLAHIIISARTLNEVLIMDTATTDDLRRMVLLEAKGRRRATIIEKLLGRINIRERRRVLEAINV